MLNSISGLELILLLVMLLSFDSPAQTDTDPRIEEMHRIINIERNTLERPMLVFSDVLSGVAREYANELAGADTAGMVHRTLKERILATGRDFLMVAQNVAYGKETARDAFDAWMRDKKHWTKMFRKEYTDIGIGYAFNERSRYRHYWVVVLGTPTQKP